MATAISLGYGGVLYQGEKYTLEEKHIYDLFSPRVQAQITKHMVFTRPLGRSKITSQKYPAWDIRFHKAILEKTSLYHTGSSNTNVPIPQLHTSHTIHTSYEEEDAGYSPDALSAQDLEGYNFEKTEEGVLIPMPGYVGSAGPSELFSVFPGGFGKLASSIFPDGSHILQKQDYLFLDVVERNTDFLKENFEIEVFLVEENPDGSEYMQPLAFFDEKAATLATQEDSLEANYPVLDPSYVEYYFNIYTDKDIDDEILCDINLKEKKSEYFIDYVLDYECPDDKMTRTYDRSVVDPEDC